MSVARPNILWLTYEDTSPQFVSCYGQTPVATTPAMDALAADGVLFRQAYATAPVCSASRSALITGCSNAATGLGHHRSKYPIPRHVLRGFPWYLRQAGYYATNNRKTDYNIADEAGFIAETWDASHGTAHWRNRPEGTPFFSVFNFEDSHQSRTMTRPWGWYEEHVLGQLPPDEVIRPESVAMPPIYRDTPEMRRHVSRVYNALRLCDRRIAERLAELRADGLADDTIVFCFADHGEGIPRGKCNGIGFGYRAAFILHVPPKFAHLSPWGAGTVTDELVSFEDLAPTVLSLAGMEAPPHWTGRAFLGARRQPPRPVVFAARDRIDDSPDLCRSAMDGRFVYTRNFFPHLPVVKYQKYGDVGEIQQAIRRDHAEGRLNAVQAELVAPERPTEYLYDLGVDGWEVRNLAGDPVYADDLARLRSAVFDHIRATRDVMFLPEREMLARAAGGTPYELRCEDRYNPLEAMLEAAVLVGGGAAAVPEQVRLLDHPEPAVRYWAAVGLDAARDHLAPHAASLCSRLAGQPAFVQIELAAALYAATRDPEARTALEHHLANGDAPTLHHVLERLLYMPAVAGDLAIAVAAARTRCPDDAKDPLAYACLSAFEMYAHLYEGAPLLYAEDVRYLAP